MNKQPCSIEYRLKRFAGDIIGINVPIVQVFDNVLTAMAFVTLRSWDWASLIINPEGRNIERIRRKTA
jgi:hypothetical protein